MDKVNVEICLAEAAERLRSAASQLQFAHGFGGAGAEQHDRFSYHVVLAASEAEQAAVWTLRAAAAGLPMDEVHGIVVTILSSIMQMSQAQGARRKQIHDTPLEIARDDLMLALGYVGDSQHAHR